MYLLAAVVGACLLGTLLCSLTEAAFYSLSTGRIETLRRGKDKRGDRLVKLRRRVEEPISAILVLNTLFTTLGAIWSGALVERHYGDFWMGVFSTGLTAALLFLGEIPPKSLGVRFADRLMPHLAAPLQWTIRLLYPVVRAAAAFTRLFGRKARISHPTEADLISIADLSHRGGKILPQERRWVRNILRLNDIPTRRIMTPVSKMARVPAGLPLKKTKMRAPEWHFSRVPVHRDGDPDNIIGMVHRRTVLATLLRGDKATTMAQLMKPIPIVRDALPSNELLEFFLKGKSQTACVCDKHGRLIGLVSLEDVLEDMIGAEIDG